MSSDSFRFPAVAALNNTDCDPSDEYDDDEEVRLTPEYSPQDHKRRFADEDEARKLLQQRLGIVDIDVRVDSFAESWGVKERVGIERIGGRDSSLGYRATPPSRYTHNHCLRGMFYNGEDRENRSVKLDMPRTPTFHAGKFGIWQAVLSYEACVRLCLNAWSRGCEEARIFLDKECALLRDAFGLQRVLLQPEEELLTNSFPRLSQELESTPKRTDAKIRVQVRKVKEISETPTHFGIKALSSKVESAFRQLRIMHTSFSSDWKSYKNAQSPPQDTEADSSACLRSRFVKSTVRYMKHMIKFMKSNGSRNSLNSNVEVQVNYSCKLRLKSYNEMDTILLHPGSSESHVFLLESPADDLIVEVLDSEGKTFGNVVAQVTTMFEDSQDKLVWFPIYHEPDRKIVGRLQLHVTNANHEEKSQLKCVSIGETLAYDLVMEAGMKEQNFHLRNLLLEESWAWLLSEFAFYYGVSDIYTKLRYVSYIMEVATPTSYCLSLVHDLLLPVYTKGLITGKLSCQEKRMLRETEGQLERVLGLVFENYKSLDESNVSGLVDSLLTASGIVAPALEPAVALYELVHNISSPEAQTSLCKYFQAAARKRLKRHMAMTDEYVSCGSSEEMLSSSVSIQEAYQKMVTVCVNIRHEIFTDLEIQSHEIIPSFVDLPNLSAAIYSTELCNRLRSFLTSCPPPGPSTPVAELVIATSDFQRDISHWRISDIKGGVNSRELFKPYVFSWIQNTHNSLLTSCKLEKVKWAGVRTEHATTPFLDKMYNHLTKTLTEFEVIIFRWPEYIPPLVNVIADVEKVIAASLEIQYEEDIAPLMDIINPRRISFKYIQKLSQRSVTCYTVSDDLGVIMNSLRRMLDVLHPEVEARVKLWTSRLPGNEGADPGDRLGEITVLLRLKFRDYGKAIAELLTANTRLQKTTRLKNILQEAKNHTGSSEIISRMQPLINLLTETVNHLNNVFETRVFIQVSRAFWNRMGQEVQSFLDTKRESQTWYKGSRTVISALDDLFASNMQHLHRDLIELRDLEARQAVAEVHNMLSNES